MELALLPIAAVLLLLSGTSAPARALSSNSPTAALIRHLFNGPAPCAERGGCSQAVRRGQLLGHQQYTGGRRSGAATGHTGAPAAQAARTTTWGQRFPRKLYRTRFGFANGAYLATAPPLA